MIRGGLEVGGITSMKDPTRSGVSGALNDMARKSGADILIWEEEIPVMGMVRSASELLGLNPLELANEGVAIIGVEGSMAEDLLEALKRDKYGRDAAIAGEVLEGEGQNLKRISLEWLLTASLRTSRTSVGPRLQTHIESSLEPMRPSLCILIATRGFYAK